MQELSQLFLRGQGELNELDKAHVATLKVASTRTIDRGTPRKSTL